MKFPFQSSPSVLAVHILKEFFWNENLTVLRGENFYDSVLAEPFSKTWFSRRHFSPPELDSFTRENTPFFTTIKHLTQSSPRVAYINIRGYAVYAWRRLTEVFNWSKLSLRRISPRRSQSLPTARTEINSQPITTQYISTRSLPIRLYEKQQHQRIQTPDRPTLREHR